MKTALILVLLALSLLLAGCVNQELLKADIACGAADTVTTVASLARGNVERNPLIKALQINSLGPVWGIVVPLVLVKVALYFALDAIDQPVLTGFNAAADCAAAAGNVHLLLR